MRTILAVVSGKGGVGKTTLSTAIGYELARSNTTLLADLDFFNRGLSAALKRRHRGNNQPPVVVKSVVDVRGEAWNLLRVDTNVFLLEPPYSESLLEMDDIEDTVVSKLIIEDVVERAADSCRAASVVLDCHGGPDNMSFAACDMADHSILVSEPDRISFYGTIHFANIAKESLKEQKWNVYLLFNRVKKSISLSFLRQFYDREVRTYFGGNPLLEVIYDEEDIAREYGNVAFLTSVYPYSIMAERVKVLLAKLFGDSAREYLSREARAHAWMARWLTNIRYGKLMVLWNTRVVLRLAFIMLASLIVVGLVYSLTDMINSFGPVAIPAFIAGTGFSIVWFFILKIYGWLFLRDRVAVYAARTRRRRALLSNVVLNNALFGGVGLVLGSLAFDIGAYVGENVSRIEQMSETFGVLGEFPRRVFEDVFAVSFLLVVLCYASVFVWQSWRLVWVLVYRLSFGEAAYRAVVCLGLYGGAVTGLLVARLS